LSKKNGVFFEETKRAYQRQKRYVCDFVKNVNSTFLTLSKRATRAPGFFTVQSTVKKKRKPVRRKKTFGFFPTDRLALCTFGASAGALLLQSPMEIE
jgi:hypothetical protein